MWKIILLFGCLLSASAYSQSITQATIKSVIGNSTYTRYEGLFGSLLGIGGETINPKESEELIFKDSILVESGKVDLVTNKGANISVLAGTNYVIGLQNMGELKHGEVYFNGNIPFKINFGYNSVQVKGTEFLISYQGDKLKDGIYVVKGEVELKPAFSFSKILIKENEQYIFEDEEVVQLDLSIKNYIETKLRGVEPSKGSKIKKDEQSNDNNNDHFPSCDCCDCYDDDEDCY